MILCIMRIGKKAKNKLSDNRGISLVELIAVISIMAVMVGLVSFSISVMFSRDASYVAKKIDDELSEARMYSMSKAGEFTFVLHIDSDTNGNYVRIDKTISGVTTPYKTVALDKSVTIAVSGTVSTPTPSASGNIEFVFDKANGCVKTVNGSKGEGVYSITITSAKNTSKVKTVTLVSTTGRHYTD